MGNLTDQDWKNWDYLVAAVQNEQAHYVNARSTRYARVIVAVSKVIDEAGLRQKVDSILTNSVLSDTHEN
jgi:hypothetical protein